MTNPIILNIVKQQSIFPYGIPNIICSYIPQIVIKDNLNNIVPYNIRHVENLSIKIETMTHMTVAHIINILELLFEYNALNSLTIDTNFKYYVYNDYLRIIDAICNFCPNLQSLYFPGSDINHRLVYRIMTNVPKLEYFLIDEISSIYTIEDNYIITNTALSENCIIHEFKWETIYPSRDMRYHVNILHDIYNNGKYLDADYNEYELISIFTQLVNILPVNKKHITGNDEKLRNVPVTNVIIILHHIYNYYRTTYQLMPISNLYEIIPENEWNHLDVFVHSKLGTALTVNNVSSMVN